MRQHLPIETISTSSLDPQTRELIRDARQGKVRVRIVDEDGQQIAEIMPIEPLEQRDIWAGYDPEAVRKALRESAGILRGVDIEELLADLKDQRW